MTKYHMTNRDKSRSVCWQYALACLLDVHPSKVPNFPKGKKCHQFDATRQWLKEKFNKGLVYLPINLFAEARRNHRYNSLGGPEGYSILNFGSHDDPDVTHTVIAKDGKYYFDPNDGVDHIMLSTPLGFFIIYDL